MSPSTELKRFMSDHAKPEDLAAFMAGVGSDADAAALVAAMKAQGYSVTTDELAISIPEARQLLTTVEQAMPAVAARNEQADVKQQELFSQIDNATKQAKAKLNTLASQGDAISVADMFEMQMLMNRLSQLSEMATSVVSATNSAMSSIARNVKG
jgi:hypothetical protein